MPAVPLQDSAVFTHHEKPTCNGMLSMK